MSSDGAKLVRAAAAGDDAKVKRLLKARADVNSTMTGERGTTGITALQNACVNGQVGAVRLLLKAKAAVDLRDSGAGSALLGASQAGELKCAQLLIEAQAAVDQPNDQLSTPLTMAAEKGHAPGCSVGGAGGELGRATRENAEREALKRTVWCASRLNPETD